MNNEDGSVSSWKIPLYKIYTDDEDLNLITKIVRRGNNWAMGPEIKEFENAIKNYVGTDYCVALNSGTSALHAAFLAYGIGHGHEIIVPSFSFISTANSVLFVGAKPNFADIEESTYGLDPKSILTKINPLTKAIVPMDYGGMSCNIFEIQEIAKRNNILLIEDAAESLGSSVKGKKVGSVADLAIFSFCGNKVLTTGEGGAIVTNSKEIHDRIKLIRSHGRVDKTEYFNNPSESQYVELGYNWRMSSITAALGISQLNKLNKIIRMRQENANYISSRISKYPEIRVPTPPSDYEHIYQMYTIKLSDKKIRDDLHDYLLRKRVFSKIYFNPIHLTEFYMQKIGTSKLSLPITERVSQQVLTLPLYPNMTSEEKEFLVESIAEFFESKYQNN
ncbi:MAG TPA: DegT/DnrJ/EryC1/StrS family aminotransferase [Nitrosopumilaceae archaeon]|nr:DegT/DnrJ/EryC1/StrS family aminotransferase [Nitrosopumilaceae archaeon]